ncbi:MAG: cytochrome ubiquinol oxidase subunit I [Dehalobacterium sp.]
MNEVLLARWQFGITSVYHFLFVPLTLGLSILVAVMQTKYYRTKDETYKKMTKFWGKLFLINFAMGVVTGIVQEFHFGMNWSEYSRFMGDIFGAPLALEALTAFYLESVFIGVWIFGWERISPKLHLASIWLVAIATNISAFWILTANSFMQHPVGFAVRNGRAEMTDFIALITNSYVLHQFPHTILAGLTTAAFFIAGISAYHLLRGSHREVFQKSLGIGLIVGLIAVSLTGLTGHTQGQYLVETQPMKMAAAEAHWETANPAPFNLVAVIDEENQSNSSALEIPGLLSFLSYNRFSGEVPGIKDLQAKYSEEFGPANYIPPVTPVFWSFRIMLAGAGLMILLSLLGLWFWKKNRLRENSWLLKALLWAIPLPYIANTAGWMLAELGRQPWLVVGLQRVEAGISPGVSAGSILLSLTGFTLIYGILAVVDLYLLAKYSRLGPVESPEKEIGITGKGVSLWN